MLKQLEIPSMLVYPPSHIPTQPVLSMASFFGGSHRHHVPSILDTGNVKFATSGRVAIALALQQMKIGKGDKVLVPAYHCASMIEPVVWAGATPVFYQINPNTSANLDDIRSKIDGSTAVLMATNYFGFPQELEKLRHFCDSHQLYFLEDCAHSFLGMYQGYPVGSYGDYAIASAMKFFPIYEGGCLVSARHKIDQVRLDSAGLGFEIKSAFNAMEKGFAYGRMAWLKAFLTMPMWLKNVIWGWVKRRAPSRTITLGPGASDGGFSFEPEWLYKRSSFFSRFLIKAVSTARIASKRRENYLALHRALSDLPGCRPLFPDLPEGVFPYVYPLVSDNVPTLFPHLKKAGVPIIRFGEFLWDGVDAEVCAVSVDLSRNVMQFPCHQDLRADELDWMINEIKSAVRLHRAVTK
jgi:perosamine synthetase